MCWFCYISAVVSRYALLKLLGRFLQRALADYYFEFSMLLSNANVMSVVGEVH